MSKTLLTLVTLAALGLPTWALQDGSEAKGKGLDRAQLELSEKGHSKLGLFVVTELDNGVRGKALAEAIHQEIATLKAEREAEKDADQSEKRADKAAREVEKDADKSKKGKPDPDADKKSDGTKGPGESLKHGLADKDITNFGKFVNEQHAAGLRGEALADAIQRRHEELKAERTADHNEDHPTTAHHNRHRSGGRH